MSILYLFFNCLVEPLYLGTFCFCFFLFLFLNDRFWHFVEYTHKNKLCLVRLRQISSTRCISFLSMLCRHVTSVTSLSVKLLGVDIGERVCNSNKNEIY